MEAPTGRRGAEPPAAEGGAPLATLKSPCALVDLSRLADNAARFRERARDLGVVLRPHVKTHKSVDVARIQHGGRPGPVTVSTLAEARAFAAAGFDDLIWAVPAAPHRLGELLALAHSTRRCDVVVDHPATVQAAAEVVSSHGLKLGVFVKVDCGAGRAGVSPDGELAAKLARSIRGTEGLCFRGLLTHAGQAYTCRTHGEVADAARRERDTLVDLAERLREQGLSVDELSVGSTPTFTVVDHLEGITEARPGNYAFFDSFQAAIGSCTIDQVAFSVLTTVTGHYPDRRELVVDAGALALSKDPGAVHVDPSCGFGVVLNEHATQLQGLRVVSLTQEHGLLRGADRAVIDALTIGSRLRIIPNHSCLAAACFDRYHVVDDHRVIDEWHPARGW